MHTYTYIYLHGVCIFTDNKGISRSRCLCRAFKQNKEERGIRSYATCMPSTLVTVRQTPACLPLSNVFTSSCAAASGPGDPSRLQARHPSMRQLADALPAASANQSSTQRSTDTVGDGAFDAARQQFGHGMARGNPAPVLALVRPKQWQKDQTVCKVAIPASIKRHVDVLRVAIHIYDANKHNYIYIYGSLEGSQRGRR
jgi:hypothetical protein